MRKVLVAATFGVAVVGLLAAPASADPVKAKKAHQFVAHCEKLGDVTVVTNGNGKWTPAHVVGTNTVLVPYELHIHGTFTPTGGSAQPISIDQVKKAPHSGRLDSCTFHDESSDAHGAYVVDGTAKVKVSHTR